MDARKATALQRAAVSHAQWGEEVCALARAAKPGEAKHAKLTSQQTLFIFNTVKSKYWRSLSQEEQQRATQTDAVPSFAKLLQDPPKLRD